jgi:alpha-L-arabinofuranosidase
MEKRGLMKKHINRRRFMELSASATVAATLGSTTAFILPTASTAAAATNLAGYWKFDEGTGTTASDSSGNSYNGTLQAGASWKSGQIGSHAIGLAGTSTSYVDIPVSVVNTAASFTVAAWVQVTAVSTSYQTFVSLDGSSVSAFYLQLRGDTGLFAFTRLGGDSTSSTTTIASAPVPPTTNTWYHLAGVYDASAQTISLYVNGSLQQTVSYTSGWQGTVGHTAIGRGKYGGSNVDFTNGQIDDVQIYSAALSAKNVADLATVGYWQFEEGSGTTAADSTGNSNTATLQAGASWTTGKVGSYALNLTGTNTSYADIPVSVVNTTASFSVSAWVKLNTLSGYQTFVSLDGSSVSAFYLQLRGDTGKFAFTRLASDSTSAAVAKASATAAPTTGTWYHLTGVYDASAKTIALYVNGVLQQIVSYTSAWQGTAGHTAIGRGKYGGSFVDFVNGQIDDVHIYNVALDYTAVNTLVGSNPSSYPALTIQANQAGPGVSSLLYGLMIEDISHSIDGGLYGELIQNRIFMDSSSSPTAWSVVQSSGSSGSIALDSTNQVNTVALTTSLKLSITTVASGGRVGVANSGFWGIPVRPNTTYEASFYAQADSTFSGPLTVDIESNDGSTVYASATVSSISTSWQKYSVTLTTGNVTASETNRFVIGAANTGTIWFNLVSLFPPTWNNHTNGTRPDLMQLLSDMKPSFLRFPGGNFLEGETLADYFPWKKSIGDLSQRPGHADPWGYRSSDGMGLLEYLVWCEDLGMSPVLAVYAGYALNGDHVTVGTTAFNQIIQDALDEIQYATGSTSTTWGAQRSADGHPNPFTIQYVEVGNEDFFDKSGSYDSRFTAIYDAIKAAYPNIKVIATTTVTSRTPDVYDQHFYPSPSGMESRSTLYNTYSRSAPKIFVGEYASQEGKPSPDMNSALGDAAFLTGLERNSDVVVMSCYAPLFANVNDLNWNTNLIAFDALNSYGSPSYYMLKTFAQNIGDVVVPTQLSGIGGLYFVASKSTSSGTIYLKVVNPSSSTVNTQIVLNTGSSVTSTGTATVISASSTSATNSLSNPKNIVPVTTQLTGLGASFNYSFAAYSITVLKLVI